ncbi:MAG: hypothetical protein ABG776_05475 [Cyanobacteria bacterium J06555_13]
MRANLQDKYASKSTEVQHPTRLISAEHIYLALQKLIALTPTEKQSLKLPIDDSEILLNQAILNMALYQRPWNEDHLLAIYRQSTSLSQNIGPNESAKPTRDHINQWIEQVAQVFQKEQLGYDPAEIDTQQMPDSLDHPVRQLKTVSKVTREINRILLKTGASQLRLKGVKSEENYIAKFLTYNFIKRLTQSVVENELLTEEFSVFIENVTVERCGPFPLHIANTFEAHGTLSRTLLDFGQHPEGDSANNGEPDYIELATHTVNKVTVQLYMRLSQASRQRLAPSAAAQLIRRGNRGDELRFEISSTGIGGTFSHVVRVLNYTLLNDVSCLRDYFPIAHEIMMEQNIVRSGAPAPVIAHSLVNLCKTRALGQAMRGSQRAGELKSYEYFAFDDPVGRGDFCGFDTLNSVANASLQARLKAIKLTGIPPQHYLTDLQDSVNNYFLLRKAQSYIASYPFSSLAQQSFLYKVFGDDWDRTLTPEDPFVYCEIQLAIAESFLTEGRHDKAKNYLQKLEAALEEVSNQGITWYLNFGRDIEFDRDQDFQIFSGALLVRYELCHAQYSYLRNDPEKAWLRLQRAEEHINVRLAKYSLIKEVSQATFHPHYLLLSKIYFLRARLLLFFPFSPRSAITNQRLRIATDVEHNNNLRSDRAVHVGRLHLLEKARLYAACDGDSELYACITAYQCCAYLITAELHAKPIKRLGSHQVGLTANQGMDWARRLRNQALLSYAKAGRQHYYQIKEKSGLSTTQRYYSYGQFEMATVPTIREQRGDEELGLIEFIRKDSTASERILYLDMSILNLDEQLIRDDVPGRESGNERGNAIYLFGPNACYLFFARGMYHLCSDNTEEFGAQVKISSLDEWRTKLAYAYRLFSYAWAIADDGGHLSTQNSNGNNTFRIERSFSVPEAVAEFDQDVASIRDLYPHRITDIASLGRLYASACAVLRGYATTDANKRQQYKTQLSWLLSELHGDVTKGHSINSKHAQKASGQQRQYNKHLKPYLRRCRHHIEEEWAMVEKSHTLGVAEIKKRRKALLQKLFSLRE